MLLRRCVRHAPAAAVALALAASLAGGALAEQPPGPVVKVVLGEPNAASLTLSKASSLPAGRVTFEVTNAGAAATGLEVCARPLTGALLTRCAGQKTRQLRHGQSATLVVTLKAKGLYEVLSTLPGRAAAGMRGVVGIGVKVTSPTPPPSTPAPATTTTTARPGSSSSLTCARPQATTVEVNEFEYAITVSQNPVPCGTVTFNVHDTGHLPFDFAVRGAVSGGTNVLDPGASASITLSLPPGSYGYVCVTCDEHWDMEGSFVVNG